MTEIPKEDQEEKPKPKGFGLPALPWKPMPYMDEYIGSLVSKLRTQEYIRKVKMGLSHFTIFCEERGLNHPEQIKRGDLILFQGYAHRRPDWNKRHRIQILQHVQGWFNWLDRMQLVEKNPWYRIKLDRVPRSPKPASIEEITLLYEAHKRTAFATQPFLWHRREVIITLLYGWGLEISELQALNVANVDLRLDYVSVRGRGGNEKRLPYHPVIKKVIQRWLQVRGRKANVGEDALLVDSTGSRMSLGNLRGIISHLGDQAGVNISPHMLRESFGTHLVKADVPLEHISKLLGHRNLNHTRTYVADTKMADDPTKRYHQDVIGDILEELVFKRTSDKWE